MIPSIFICILYLVLSSTFSNGLKCYTCEHLEGWADPLNCRSQPSENCLIQIESDLMGTYANWKTPSISFPHWNSRSEIHFRKDSNSSVIRNKMDENVDWLEETLNGKKKKPKKFCIKAIGIYNGKNYINRFGVTTFMPGLKVDCQPLPSSSGLINGTVCFCDSDACNSARISFILPFFTPILFLFVITNFIF